MLEHLAGWLLEAFTLRGEVNGPICGLIVVFMGWKRLFRKGERKLGSVMFTTGAIVTIAGVTRLASPGVLTRVYAICRDLNLFS
jgi:hypothetical protein